MNRSGSMDEADEAVFSINGKIQRIAKIDVDTSLNTYLRNHLGLTGTKVMCSEGSCGSCVVNMKITDPFTGRDRSIAVNSCLLPILSCHGSCITTVEGIGSQSKGYNKVQTTLAHFSGSQCGFCSPGFVMTMYSLLDRNPDIQVKEVEESFSGNLCRCTGYRPILDAFKSLASDPPVKLQRKLIEIEESHLYCPNRDNCQKSSLENCDKCFRDANFECSLDFSEIALASERLLINDTTRQWYKVETVKHIMEVFDMIGNLSYILVSGNTAQGVTVKKREEREIDPIIWIDIRGVKELKTRTLTATCFTFGSGVTLDILIEILQKLGNDNINFRYAKQMAKHLKQVANVPVRNLASVGGNLYFSHQHPDFPSDVNLLLDAVSARITIESLSGVTQTVTPSQFRSMDLNKKVITKISLYPKNPPCLLKSYKVMQVAQNSVAAVNGAFLYNLNNMGQLITKPSIVFSGINDIFRHAEKTEEYLFRKNIFDKNVIENSLKLLENEVHPDTSPPNFSPEYRKLVALSLFYRSVLAVDPTKVQDKFKSGSEPIKRLVSSGKQVYYTDQQEWPLTQPKPKMDSQIQCSGEAKYTKDLSAEGVLFGKFVLASAIGEIQNIDGTKALAMKGVQGFYTAKDIPGINNLFQPTPTGKYEMELLCSSKVLYNGQPIAIIVAINELTAVRASKLVEVTYTNIQSNILTNIKDVLASKEQDRIAIFDSVQAAKRPSNPKYKFSGEVIMGGQYSHAMETQSTLVIPRENGLLKIKSATQAITSTVVGISNITGIPLNKLECSVKRIGGGFGSKVTSHLFNAAGAALGAAKLNKPVKMTLTSAEEMTIIGKRTSVFIRYEGGIDETGKLQGLDINAYFDMGSKLSVTYFTILPYIRYIFPNCYDSSTWSYTGYTVKTDLPPSSILRSPGFLPMFTLTEQIMDHAAFVAKLHPINVRVINAGDQYISKYISDWRNSTCYDERESEISQFNKENRWKKKGISLCCMRYPFDYFYREIGCSVSILWPDGTVQIVHGGIEMGQGINTKVAQVVAKELDVDIKTIEVLSARSVVTPNNHQTVASVAGELACYAALKCCQDLNARIDPVRKEMNKPTWKELVSKLFYDGINLNANYLNGVERSKSELYNYNVYGVNVTETEVDILTGERKITRVDILEDVGKSISPEIDVGQVEGAFIMGLGLSMCERIILDPKTGALLNNKLWNYKIPTSKDIPEDFRITFVPNSTNPGSVLGSKAVGEPSIALSVGVINSFRNALMSARSDAGFSNDWLKLDSPCTIERLLMNSGTSPDQFTL